MLGCRKDIRWPESTRPALVSIDEDIVERVAVDAKQEGLK